MLFATGVGRLIADSQQTPLVLPIHIQGGGGLKKYSLQIPCQRLVLSGPGLETVKKLKDPRIRLGQQVRSTGCWLLYCPRTALTFSLPTIQLSAQLGTPLDLTDDVRRLKEQYGLNNVGLGIVPRRRELNAFCPIQKVPIRQQLTAMVRDALIKTQEMHIANLAEHTRDTGKHSDATHDR